MGGLILGIVLTIALPAMAKEGAFRGGKPFVLAHYVDWFSTDTPLTGKKWEHWSNAGEHGHDPTHRGE